MGRTTLYAALAKGDLASIKIGTRRLIRLDAIRDWLARHETEPKGMLWCSQVAPGNENALNLRVYGEKGGLEWSQEDPNRLWFTPYGQPKHLITRGGSGATDAAQRMSRTPAGHPEGYLECFANIYSEAAEAIVAWKHGIDPDEEVTYANIDNGLDGVRFVDACVRSSSRNSAWVAV